MKEQFYIAVQSEPEVPRPGVPGQEDDAGQMTAPGDSEDPRAEEKAQQITNTGFL